MRVAQADSEARILKLEEGIAELEMGNEEKEDAQNAELTDEGEVRAMEETGLF